MNAIIWIVCIVACIAVIYSLRKHQLDKQQHQFNEDDFVDAPRPEKPRPVVSLEDAPLAQVFRISDDPLERLEHWATAASSKPVDVRENFYMSITEQSNKEWTHPFLPDMHPQSWVRIIAPDYEEARKIAVHYSGGHYAVIQNQRQFNDIKDIYFNRGEYELLDSNSYWTFLKDEAL